jgi:hypothetical protein
LKKATSLGIGVPDTSVFMGGKGMNEDSGIVITNIKTLDSMSIEKRARLQKSW